MSNVRASGQADIAPLQPSGLGRTAGFFGILAQAPRKDKSSP
jgi:hypothetical protein